MDASRWTVLERDVPLRLVVADDHLIVAQGIRSILVQQFDSIELVNSGEMLLECIRRSPPDLVVADISMPGLSGIEVMAAVRDEGCMVPFIFLTMHGESALAAAAIRGGARGYILKSEAGEELLRAIRVVREGGTYITPTLAADAITSPEHPQFSLTDKQNKILQYVARGLRSKQIAYELGVSVRTVESHKYAIMQELGVHGTVELVRKAALEGLIQN